MKKLFVLIVCVFCFVMAGCDKSKENTQEFTPSTVIQMAVKELTSEDENHYTVTDNGNVFKVSKKGKACRVTFNEKTVYFNLGTGYAYEDMGDNKYELSHAIPFGAYEIFTDNLKNIETLAQNCVASDDCLSFNYGGYDYKLYYDDDGIVKAYINSTLIERAEDEEKSEMPIRFSYSNKEPLLNFMVQINDKDTVICPLNFGNKTVDVVRFDCNLPSEERTTILQNVSYVAPVLKLKKEASVFIKESNILKVSSINLFGEVHYDGESSLDTKTDTIKITIIDEEPTLKNMIKNVLYYYVS